MSSEMDNAPRAPLMSDIAPSGMVRLPLKTKFNFLKRINMNKMLSPRAILQLALNVLHGGSGMYEAERMQTYELVVVEALGSGQKEVAKEYLTKLEKRFGLKSTRVMSLQGLYLEAEGKVAEAKRTYGEILKADPGNAFAIQRLSAMEKAQGNIREAARILENDLVYTDDNGEKHTYLQIHRTDVTAFRELSKLFYELNDLEKAAFYAEEEILFNNDSYILHCRLGEILYQQKDYVKSVSSFAHSLLMNPSPNNTRAAYGLRQSTAKVLAAHRSGSVRMPDETAVKFTEELHEMVAEKLLAMYRESPLLPAVEQYIQKTAL